MQTAEQRVIFTVTCMIAQKVTAYLSLLGLTDKEK